MKRKILPLIVLIVIGISACHKDNRITPELSAETRSYASDQIRNYFSMMCTITKNTKGFYPTQAARAYGYIGIAAYESVRNGIPGALSLSGQVNCITSIPQPDPGLLYNWAISSNAAIAQMMRNMFVSSTTTFNMNTIDSTETANLAILSKG